MLSNLLNNSTSVDFLILPFSSNSNYKFLSVAVFFIIYMMGIILNSVVILVLCLDPHLHTPMYLFFCNLSVIDIFYSTVIVPKLLHILLSGNGLLTFSRCFTQIYFFFVAASAEVILFFVMAFDRHFAICHPLHYSQILSLRNSALIMAVMWVSAFINSLFFIVPLLNLRFDPVVILHQFFCDAITVFHSSYGGATSFYIVICMECVLFGLCPFFCNLVSYIKIFYVIAHNKSREGQRKALSTCSSHLIVMMIYYTTGGSHLMSSFHQTEAVLNKILSMSYSTVVPMINPLVYSLRNNEIKKALQKLRMRVLSLKAH